LLIAAQGRFDGIPSGLVTGTPASTDKAADAGRVLVVQGAPFVWRWACRMARRM